MAWRVPILLFASLCFAMPALAAGSGKPKSDERPAAYDEGIALVEAGDFEDARKSFEKAVRKKSRDPDALNMLAIALRKTGHLDRAISDYKKALGLRPRFPRAREYLAEAYLQATLRELETLESYGKEAESEHAQLVKALRTAVWGLAPAADPAKKENW